MSITFIEFLTEMDRAYEQQIEQLARKFAQQYMANIKDPRPPRRSVREPRRPWDPWEKLKEPLEKTAADLADTFEYDFEQVHSDLYYATDAAIGHLGGPTA